ncbi:MAG: two-CW domain-containing protein [bacterium]
MKKINCWEFKKCGRHAGGEHEKDMGICPATVEKKLDRIHGGSNGGRACWVVSGTMCGGVIQGTFAKKYSSCSKCDFYKTVRQEEHPKFQLSAVLLNILKEG